MGLDCTKLNIVFTLCYVWCNLRLQSWIDQRYAIFVSCSQELGNREGRNE